MTTMMITPIAAVRAPRAAEWAASAAAALLSAWSGLAESRANQRLLKSRSDEAAALRRFADSVNKGDPGFAADLYAAANRHEVQG